MRILNDEVVIDFLQAENNNAQPDFSQSQVQIHIDYKCGCKITQDVKGNSLFPCKKHYGWAQQNANNEVLHAHIH